MSRLVLGGGCFWCLEAAYQMVRGVTSVTPGYAGGQTEQPTYSQVCSGTTGHAEVVEVEFDETIIDLKQILEVFFTIHDPTTPNAQGADIGSQYRSIILYLGAADKSVIDQVIQTIKPLWPRPIVTEVAALERFYPAEAEHKNYFLSHPEAAYCQIVINPKLAKLRQSLAGLIA